MTHKTFDAVKLMRQLRDKLSQEMEEMAPTDRLKYIRDKAAATSFEKGHASGETKTDQNDNATNQTSADR